MTEITVNDDDDVDTDDVVRLKLNGKLVKCTRCKDKNKTFNIVGIGPRTYKCTACRLEVGWSPSDVVEELLPPRNDWRTPGGTAMAPVENGLWTTLHREYHFNLDAAADAANTKCSAYYDGLTSETDALVQPWLTHLWWCTTCRKTIHGDNTDLLEMQTGTACDNGLFRSAPEDAQRLELMVPQLLSGGGANTPTETSGGPDRISKTSNARTSFCDCGLSGASRGTVAWINPPYQPKGVIELWLRKALSQASVGVKSVLLLPMTSSVAWFNDLVIPYSEWHTFRGRIAFEDPLAAPDAARTSPKQDNLLVIFDPHSNFVGHGAVRDSRTGERLWTHPGAALHSKEPRSRP